MKVQWHWDREFEHLMQVVGAWLAKNGEVRIVSTNFGFDGQKYYYVIIYG